MHHEAQKLMNTGLPWSFASENGRPANDVPVIDAAANGWNPAGGTTTFFVSMCETSSCLLSPKANTPPMAISATIRRRMAAPYRLSAGCTAPRGAPYAPGHADEGRSAVGDRRAAERRGGR